MINNDIAEMLRRGGKWAVLVNGGSYFMVDVEPNGAVHQLKPDEATRDGELRLEGWIGNEKVYEKTGNTFVAIWKV